MRTCNQRLCASALAVAIGFALAAEAKKRNNEPAVIAARSLVFGKENVNQKNGLVDPDRVIGPVILPFVPVNPD